MPKEQKSFQPEQHNEFSNAKLFGESFQDEIWDSLKKSFAEFTVNIPEKRNDKDFFRKFILVLVNATEEFSFILGSKKHFDHKLLALFARMKSEFEEVTGAAYFPDALVLIYLRVEMAKLEKLDDGKFSDSKNPSAFNLIKTLFVQGFEAMMEKNHLNFLEFYETISKNYNQLLRAKVEIPPHITALVGDCLYYTVRTFAKPNFLSAEEIEILNQAQFLGNSAAQNVLGVHYLRARRYDQALPLLESAVQGGDPEAAYNLGLYYRQESAAGWDAFKAIRYFQLAMEGGIKEAENNLADIIAYLKSSTDNIADQQNILGLCYQNGWGVAYDPKEAFKCFEQASNLGNSDAKNSLALCYKNGFGVDQDIEYAVNLFREAVNNGNIPAQYNLALCYQNGIGVAQDFEEAVRLIQEAEEFGGAFAQNDSGIYYDNFEESDDEKKESKAEENPPANNLGLSNIQSYQTQLSEREEILFLQSAAEKGDAEAQIRLGIFYINNNPDKKDDTKALALFKSSYKSGNALAGYYLGLCYQDGIGVKTDFMAALKLFCEAEKNGILEARNAACDIIRLFETAAARGNKLARTNLLICYRDGIGVVQSLAKAAEFLEPEKKVREESRESKEAVPSAPQEVLVIRIEDERESENENKTEEILQVNEEENLVDTVSKLKKEKREIRKRLKEERKKSTNWEETEKFLKKLEPAQHEIHKELDEALISYLVLDIIKIIKEYVLVEKEDVKESDKLFDLGLIYFYGEKSADQVFWKDDGKKMAKGEVEIIKRNLPEAERYFDKAVRHGHRKAASLRASCYLQNDWPFPEGVVKAQEILVEDTKKGSPYSQYYLGALYGKGQIFQKDLEEAIRLMKLSADKNFAPARKLLADLQREFEKLSPREKEELKKVKGRKEFEKYESERKKFASIGKEENLYRAVEKLKLSAKLKDSQGQFRLSGYNLVGYINKGDDPLKSPNRKKAFHLCKLAAEQGDSMAQLSLGECYQTGFLVEKDGKEAVRLYRLAIEQGNIFALANLGVCYQHGVGVEKDYDEAIRLFNLGIEKGDKQLALCNLAVCYQMGLGVPQDKERAVDIYKSLAEKNSHARLLLGLCYKDGVVVERDHGKAFQLFMASKELPESQLELGMCYQNEIGVAKDLEKGFGYFELASENGVRTATYNKAVCYQGGYGVKKDDKEAFRLYEILAKAGDKYAQNNLAYCYEKGIGVTKNHRRAFEFYIESAKQGSEVAESSLKKYYRNDILSEILEIAKSKNAQKANEDRERTLFLSKFLVNYQDREYAEKVALALNFIARGKADVEKGLALAPTTASVNAIKRQILGQANIRNEEEVRPISSMTTTGANVLKNVYANIVDEGERRKEIFKER